MARTKTLPTTLYLSMDNPRAYIGDGSRYANIRATVTAKNPEDRPYDRVINGVLIDNLALTGQIDNTHASFYAIEPAYHDVLTVDARKATAMAKGLDKLHKRQSKLAEQWGPAQSFSEALRYFAHAMGAVEIKIHNPDSPAADSNGWVTHPLPGGFSAVDRFEKRAIETLHPATES